MFLSIIVPVYGVEKYINRCLDSLVNQNISYDEYEIICIDDGTKDNSGNICDEYARKHSNITVIHKKNGGLSSARNAGLEIAKGNYVWFVDPDDFIRENVLLEIKQAVLESDCDILSIIPYAFKDEDEQNLDINSVDVSMSQTKFKSTLWTKIIRTKLIKENHLRFEPITDSIEDATFDTQLKYYIKKSVIVDSKVVYFYRLRYGSMTDSKDHIVIPARLRSSVICKEIIENKRAGDVPSAYILLHYNMALVMNKVAKMEKSRRKEKIKEIKALDLFPLKYNRKYKVNRNSDDDSFFKRVKLYVYSVGYTWWGYRMSVLLNSIRNFGK